MNTDAIIPIFIVCIVFGGVATLFYTLNQQVNELNARADCSQDCADLVSYSVLDHSTFKNGICTCYWFEDKEYTSQVLLDPCDDPYNLGCLPG